MFGVGAPCFLLVPNDRNERVLVPGTVRSVAPGEVVSEFDDPVCLAPSADVTLYGNIRGKFHQQAAIVLAIESEAAPDPLKPPFRFSLIGKPVSSESRGSYRVSIVANQYRAQVNKITNCLLVDISPEGCGVLSPKPLVIGQSVDVNFTCDDTIVRGAMKVQTLKTLRSGAERYGLLAPEATSLARKTLEQLSGEMQRQQLKRLAGAA